MPVGLFLFALSLLAISGGISIYQRLQRRAQKKAAIARSRHRMRSLDEDSSPRFTEADMDILRRRMQSIGSLPVVETEESQLDLSAPHKTPLTHDEFSASDSNAQQRWQFQQTQAEAADLKRKLDSGDFEEFQAEIDSLIDLAWPNDVEQWAQPFLMTLDDFDSADALSDVVTTFLTHARACASGLSIPWLTPRVVVEDTGSAAGLFVVSSGWVTVKVGPEFERDRLSTIAILAHEVCHYILGNSGIRKPNRLSNERYTDICLFVCGFGPVFLKGYSRPLAQTRYRPMHRLGYLTDAEYSFVSQYVKHRRHTG